MTETCNFHLSSLTYFAWHAGLQYHPFFCKRHNSVLEEQPKGKVMQCGHLETNPALNAASGRRWVDHTHVRWNAV